MNQDELVSIIMPSYNTAKFIKVAVNSVLAQTYKKWELIIVDDCSTDNTDEIIHFEYRDSRIRYLKNTRNMGAAVSRNKGLKEAKGKWIAFLDSDDIWMPKKLEYQIKFMKKHKINFSYTCYKEIDENGNDMHAVISGPKRITKSGMHNYCWPGCLTVMYNAEQVGLIQIANIKKNNDYAMWLKVCEKADCYLYPKVLAKYRRGREGSISTYGYWILILWHYKLWREAEQKSVITSTINTGRNVIYGVYKQVRYKNKL